MEEFRLKIDLYGDRDNFGLLVIYDQRSGLVGSSPAQNYPMNNATPEQIGQYVTDYLKRYYMER